MAQRSGDAVRQRAKLAMGEKVDVGGGKRNYSNGGAVDPRYQSLEQKRDPKRAAEMAAYARGEKAPSTSSDEDGILTKAARAVRKAITGGEGLKRGGKVTKPAVKPKAAPSTARTKRK